MINDAATNAATNLRRLRTAQGLTLGQVSEMLERSGWRLTIQQLHMIEKGKRRMDIADAAAIADVLGVHLGRLVASPDADLDDVRRLQAMKKGLDELLRLAKEHFADGNQFADRAGEMYAEAERLTVRHLQQLREVAIFLADRPAIGDAAQALLAYHSEQHDLLEDLRDGR